VVSPDRLDDMSGSGRLVPWANGVLRSTSSETLYSAMQSDEQ
jgi:hypothetical protein